MKMPKFKQIQMFSSEIIILLDRGAIEDISQVCENLETGSIVEYIYKKYSFQNREVSLESISDVNGILKKFYVSEQEASKKGIDSNGLAYILELTQEVFVDCLYNLRMNDIDPENYSDFFN